MRHTVYLMIGEDMEALSPLVKQYTLMYGEGEAPCYLKVLSCVNDNAGSSVSFKSHVHLRPETETTFSSGLENEFLVGTDTVEELSQDVEIQQYFNQLFNRTVTIENPGSDGTLDICVLLPLYDAGLWALTQRLLKCIQAIGKQVRVDILGLPSEISMLISPEEDRKGIPEKLESYRETCKTIGKELVGNEFVHRLILFEDTNCSGLALNLDKDRLVRVLGEFALLYVEHYHVIFPNNQMGKKIDVTSFGFSLLAFDKIYFVHYLLRKAYLYILNREKVDDEEKININHAAEVAQQMLEKHVNLYQDFVRDKVEPTIAKNRSNELLLSDTQRLEAELNEEIKSAIEDLQGFIADPKLSLPEKQAIMAQILGEDDPLVDGVQYFKDQLILDDYDADTLNYLIQEDNKAIEVIAETETSPRKVKRGVLQAPIEEGSERVYLPLDDIKLLRAKIRQRTTYIRKKTEELDSLVIQVQDSEQIQRRISDNSFHYGEEVFKLLPSDGEARLFEETYVPAASIERNVDLRKSFTSVKNQGTMGACSAFALVSIFEFILKKSNQADHDLSERFAYFNALHKKGNVEDKGASFFDMVETMSVEGIATEALCPYENGLEKPTEDAYADGKTRLVKVAKNVRISHESLTSALSQGYPVAVSLRLFNSFATDKAGFIYRPSDEEIASGDTGNHAMVLCGYSEEDKIYIVRNSWGTGFGDRGYCYIPFSYIEDPELNSQACIITDIDVANEIKVSGCEKATVSFNLTDDNIRRAILRVLIDEENQALKKDTQIYAKLRYDYEKLLQVLANPTKRDEIYENSIRILDKDIRKEQANYTEFVTRTRPAELSLFKKATFRYMLKDLGAIAFFVFLLYLFFKVEWRDGIMYDTIILAGIAIFSIFFFWYRKYQWSMLKKELDEKAANINSRISQLKKEKTEKHLRLHLAGNVVSTLTDIKLKLVDKYNGIVSYNHALKNWLLEERQKLEEMILPNKTPSIPLFDNEVLDGFFEENMERLTKDICLYDLVGSKSMTDEDILSFKFSLRDKLVSKLKHEYSGFSMIDYVTGKTKFAYLRNEENLLGEIIPKMDMRSAVFLNIEMNGEIFEDCYEKHLFLHSVKQEQRNVWRDMYKIFFSQLPSDNDLDSEFKLIELQVHNLDADQVSLFK